jgi:hypothetical protein
MQKPTSTTPVDRCVSLATYFETAVARYIDLFAPDKAIRAQLQMLAKNVHATIGELGDTQATALQAATACIAPRVEVRLVDLKADNIVRSVQRLAAEEGIDDVIFPDGVTPIIKPVGQSEIDSIHPVVARIEASKWSDRKAQAKRLTDVTVEYTSALAKRRTAALALGQARAVRDTAREDYLDAYAKACSGVQSIFPRDRTTQDIFFDDVRAGAAADAGGEEPPAAAPTPAAKS